MLSQSRTGENLGRDRTENRGKHTLLEAREQGRPLSPSWGGSEPMAACAMLAFSFPRGCDPDPRRAPRALLRDSHRGFFRPSRLPTCSVGRVRVRESAVAHLRGGARVAGSFPPWGRTSAKTRKRTPEAIARVTASLARRRRPTSGRPQYARRPPPRSAPARSPQPTEPSVEQASHLPSAPPARRGVVQRGTPKPVSGSWAVPAGPPVSAFRTPTERTAPY